MHHISGESGVDQLVEIIKILGTPNKDEINAMNKNHGAFKFPEVKPYDWTKVFHKKTQTSNDAINLLSKMLVYDPSKRITLQALADHILMNYDKKIQITIR